MHTSHALAFKYFVSLHTLTVLLPFLSFIAHIHPNYLTFLLSFTTIKVYAFQYLSIHSKSPLHFHLPLSYFMKHLSHTDIKGISLLTPTPFNQTFIYLLIHQLSLLHPLVNHIPSTTLINQYIPSTSFKSHMCYASILNTTLYSSVTTYTFHLFS